VSRQLHAVMLVVRDYDEAIAWYVQKLEFVVLEDTDMGGGKRWVVIAPGPDGARLVLGRASTPAQVARIGDATGGRVFLFVQTDDFARDYQNFTARGVKFISGPRHEEYGTVGVFEDLYGYRWDLVEPRVTVSR
jgi:catechol 2,3-dioxygenase-like lactoylglutathione lyase family enzyme